MPGSSLRVATLKSLFRIRGAGLRYQIDDSREVQDVRHLHVVGVHPPGDLVALQSHKFCAVVFLRETTAGSSS